MSADARRDPPVRRASDERAVPVRPAERDEEEGWSITIRPSRPRPMHELLRDLSSSNSGCK
jgi:hypothetical protein